MQMAMPGLHGANSLHAESDGKLLDKARPAGDRCTWKIKQGRRWKLLGWRWACAGDDVVMGGDV